jgi:ABC-type nickel/cobalt efflux system permease component RcnA
MTENPFSIRGMGVYTIVMNQTVLLTIAATGFSVAFLHAAIPTHWLPFVMAARTQKWSKAKTMCITAIAGGGHVLLTTLLGVIIVWAGIALDQRIGRLFPFIAGGALLLFGLYYIVQHLRGGHSHSHFLPHKHGGHHEHHDETHQIKGHHDIFELSVFETGAPPKFRIHFFNLSKKPIPVCSARSVTVKTVRPDGQTQLFSFQAKENFLESVNEIPEPHEFGVEIARDEHGQPHTYNVVFKEHEHSHHEDANLAALQASRKPPTSDRVAVLGLITLLTFSPCEGFLPIYLSGIAYGWVGFVILSVILASATLLGMMVFTWLTLTGIEKLNLSAIEKYEGLIMGCLLSLLGVGVMLFEL